MVCVEISGTAHPASHTATTKLTFVGSLVVALRVGRFMDYSVLQS